MAHLEGVLTLVTGSGPWFRVQGRHVRDGGGLTVRVGLDPHTGVTVDVHLAQTLWVRAGWFPRHTMCKMRATGYPVGGLVHRCWARVLRPRSYDVGQLIRRAGRAG